MVSVPAFYSVCASSNLTEVYSKLYEKNENRPGLAHLNNGHFTFVVRNGWIQKKTWMAHILNDVRQVIHCYEWISMVLLRMVKSSASSLSIKARDPSSNPAEWPKFIFV